MSIVEETSPRAPLRTMLLAQGKAALTTASYTAPKFLNFTGRLGPGTRQSSISADFRLVNGNKI